MRPKYSPSSKPVAAGKAVEVAPISDSESTSLCVPKISLVEDEMNGD